MQGSCLSSAAHTRAASARRRRHWCQQSCSKALQCQAVVAPERLTSPSTPEPSPASAVNIQAAQTSHFPQVAKLRANAYYENERNRFVETFKKQFVCQEVESLQRRTAPGRNGAAPQCECLVALDAQGADNVIGCIDIRLPCAQTGVHPAGVPSADPQGAYILNVVVHEDWRGQGVGRALMRAAMARAVGVWHAQFLYTHVQADNEVAFQLYARCGFEEHSAESKFANTTALGKLVLLRAPATAAGVQ